MITPSGGNGDVFQNVHNFHSSSITLNAVYLDCDGCPHPELHLPLPQQPFGMENLRGWDKVKYATRVVGRVTPSPSLQESSYSKDTCDSTRFIADQQSYFENSCLDTAIVDCSYLLVIMLIIVVVIIFW